MAFGFHASHASDQQLCKQILAVLFLRDVLFYYFLYNPLPHCKVTSVKQDKIDFTLLYCSALLQTHCKQERETNAVLKQNEIKLSIH